MGPKHENIIIGDVMLDQYIYGSITRISPEAPIPVFLEDHCARVLGGAANVALNMTRMGLKTTLIGSIGKDNDGKDIKKLLKEHNIDFYPIYCDQPSIVKTRHIADGQQVGLRADREKQFVIDAGQITKIMDFVGNKKPQFIAFSDYNKGTLSEVLIKQLMSYSHKHAVSTVVDTKPGKYEHYKGATIIKPNTEEFLEEINHSKKLLSEVIGNNKFFEANGMDYASKLMSHLVITRSQHGMTYIDPVTKRISHNGPIQNIRVSDVSGGGDTAMAGLIYGINQGKTVEESIYYALAASEIAVQQRGTYAVSEAEMLKYLQCHRK